MITGFAKRQLEKCGWSEGEGIGKNKQGIVKPVKASLKLSTSGLGYDMTESYSTGWWVDMFNASAKNIKTDKTKKIKSLDKQVELSSSSSLTNQLSQQVPHNISSRFALHSTNHLQLHKYTSFVKCETLHPIYSKAEAITDVDDGEIKRERKKRRREERLATTTVLRDDNIFNNEDVSDNVTVEKRKKSKRSKRCKMEPVDDEVAQDHTTNPTTTSISHDHTTINVKPCKGGTISHKIHKQDNNLNNQDAIFLACGGLTCHKAARHGLGLNGKLARIAQQDLLLMMTKTG